MDLDTERIIEWDCKQLLARYYQHVDHDEFEEAANIFTHDIVWRWRQWSVTGRENMLKDLRSSLTGVHIRHLISNTVVKVIDLNNAQSLSYVTIYTHKEKLESGTAGLLKGPDFINELQDKLVCLDDGWHIAERHISTAFERERN